MHKQLLAKIEGEAKRVLRGVGLLRQPTPVKLTRIVVLRMSETSPARAAQLPLAFYARERNLPM